MVDYVSSVEEFDLGSIRNSEKGIPPPDFGILIGDPLVWRGGVAVSSFDHKRPWRQKACKFRVIEGVREIELSHFVLLNEQI